MLIFIIKREKIRTSKGFSLIEILVAMALVAFIMTLVTSFDTFSMRGKLEQVLDKIETSILFSVDEASLRNAIIRVHFFPSTEPQEFNVEYGPNENFVIPLKSFEDIEDPLEDDEEQDTTDPLNSKFNRVPELKDENNTIVPPIRLIGIGTSLYQKLLSERESSLYIYPTGEKDDAIIIVGSDTELGVLEVSAFDLSIKRSFHPLPEDEDEDIQDIQDELADKLYNAWLTK